MTSESFTQPESIGHGSQASRLNGGTRVRARLAEFARDIKIIHTVFAMPFALLSTFLAAGGWPKLGQIGLILVCMVTARTLAMGMNRLLDAKIDAGNPRTKGRAIPGGKLSRTFVIGAVILCAGAFIGATALFWIVYHNPWPLILSVPVLAYLAAYPLLKRFTRFCHYYLGVALALVPICAWIAIRGRLEMPPIWMALAVAAWTAGFDIIYACQDYACDIQHGLFSIPAKLGISRALWVARLTHLFSFAMLLMLGRSAHPPLGMLYFIGVGLAGMLLIIEHSLVKPTDLSKVGLAFFTVNGIISLILGTLGVLDVILWRSVR
jgi:4-hydroxybenzoate polyprenyltransferase